MSMYRRNPPPYTTPPSYWKKQEIWLEKQNLEEENHLKKPEKE